MRSLPRTFVDVLLVELLLLEHGGVFAAVEPRGALGVEAHRAEAPTQVGRVDRARSRAGSRRGGSGRARAAGRRPSWTARSCSAARCSRAPTGPHRAWGAGSRCGSPARRRSAGQTWVVGPWLGPGEAARDGGAQRHQQGGGGWVTAESARPTDHAARTTEVHVAAYHQVRLVRATDHAAPSLRGWTPLHKLKSHEVRRGPGCGASGPWT